MTLFSRGLGAGVLLGTSVCCNAAMRAPPLPDAELAAVHAQYAGAPATAPTLSLSVPQLNGSLLGLFMGLAFVKAEPPPPPAGNGH
jgi:hypothetical protein